jgi:hypothetical protein
MELPAIPGCLLQEDNGASAASPEVQQILAAVTRRRNYISGRHGTPMITEMAWKRTLPGVSGLGDLRIRHPF